MEWTQKKRMVAVGLIYWCVKLLYPDRYHRLPVLRLGMNSVSQSLTGIEYKWTGRNNGHMPPVVDDEQIVVHHHHRVAVDEQKEEEECT